MNKKELKILEPIITALERMVGSYYAGLFIAHITDSLREYAKDGDREIRKLTITFNDYFSYDLDTRSEEEKNHE